MINLKAKRLKRGLTMKQLGALVGISESAYCLIEHGKRRLTLDLASKIAQSLDCSVDDLINRKEESA